MIDFNLDRTRPLLIAPQYSSNISILAVSNNGQYDTAFYEPQHTTTRMDRRTTKTISMQVHDDRQNKLDDDISSPSPSFGFQVFGITLVCVHGHLGQKGMDKHKGVEKDTEQNSSFAYCFHGVY
jgi:hypothetical protein